MAKRKAKTKPPAGGRPAKVLELGARTARLVVKLAEPEMAQLRERAEAEDTAPSVIVRRALGFAD